MSPEPQRPRRASAPPRVAGWAGLALAALLVGAQALGLWHRTEHAPAPGHVVALAHAEHGASVFGHDADESTSCRLYDQLALGDALQALAVVLPVFEPARAVGAPRVERVARQAPLRYRARGPPAIG